MNRVQYRCQKCGLQSKAQDLRTNAWGDAICPRCGSLRVERKPSRLDLVKNFFIEYNRY